MSENHARRALVTGATGFIGRRVVHMFIEQGWEVHAIVRPTSDCKVLPEKLTRHVDDGSRRAIESAVGEASASVCLHLAGLSIGTHEPDDVSELIAANITFPARLAEALSYPTAPLFINAGTYWQHVSSSPHQPPALYAVTKQAAEDILHFYAGIGQLRVVSLKLPNSYGPYESRPKLINILLTAVATGQQVELSSGDQYVDLVYVDDVARAFLIAAEQFMDTETPLWRSYSVSSGSPLRVREVASWVEQVTKAPVPALWGARPYRRHEMFKPLNVGPPLPGWQPQVSLEEGLEQTWNALQKDDDMAAGKKR